MNFLAEIRLENMKRLVEEVGSVAELAKRAGYAQPSYLYQIINQTAIQNGKPKNIGGQMARKLEKAMNKAVGWLDIKHNEDDATPVIYRSNTPVVRAGWISIPHLTATGKMGDGIEADDPDAVIDFIVIAQNWARRQFGGNISSLRVINAKGDSMADTIAEGDVVFVDSSISCYDGDGIYVIRTASGLRIKRLQALVTEGLKIISDNKAYDAEIVVGQNLENIHICGKVKGRWTLDTF